MLPPFFDRPGAELLLAPAFASVASMAWRCCERRVDGVTVDYRGRGGGHRTGKVREVEDVAHHLHGQIALRRLSVAGRAASAPDVVVEGILGSRALRARRRRCLDCVGNVCHSNAGLNSSLSSLNVAEAAFIALLRRTPDFITRALQLRVLATDRELLTAAGCLRLRFVLLRISDTESANQSWPAPAPMFVALKTTG